VKKTKTRLEVFTVGFEEGSDKARPIRGRHRLALLRDLAVGDFTAAELAEKYDRAVGTINTFKYNHKAEIAEIRSNPDDEFAGLWIAQKKNRIAVYQSQVDRLEESDDPKLLARSQTALRSVAEELGQLPNKSTVAIETPKLQVQIEGISDEDLKRGTS
jgi:hypothetical protein